MDQPRIPPDDNGGPVELPVERDDSPEVEAAGQRTGPRIELPELVRPPREPLPGTAGGPEWRRWRLYGCAAGVLGLVALLAFGTHMMRNTVWLTYRSAHSRVVASLVDASPPDRMRTIRNLDAFTQTLQSMEEPYALMGEFQRQVNEILRDGRLDRSETESLNQFLESSLEDHRGE